MPDFQLLFPDGFEEYEWVVPSKGWFPGATLVVDGRRYALTFYDREKLMEAIDDEHSRRLPFFEPNLLVVESVTRRAMEQAARHLVETEGVGLLVPEPAEDGA